MSYVTQLLLALASRAAVKTQIRQQIEHLWNEHRDALEQAVLKFVQAEISPAAMFDFETRIAERIQAFARQLVEKVLNRLEVDDPVKLPHDLKHQGGGYRRLNRKTRNAHVATLFGTIELWRYRRLLSRRPAHLDDG
jgi:hypothetical protein